jgi:hypothetical protein
MIERRSPNVRILNMRFLLCIALTFLMPLGLLAGEKAREGTEWDTAYWYNANNDKLPRVLLLGDSICNQYSPLVNAQLAGVAYVSFWATSKCVTDRSYLKQLAYILEEYPYAVVHFNNGLHSLGTDPIQWEAGLKAALALIREKQPRAKIILATSTPLNDPIRTEKVKVLNEICGRVAKENGLPTDDLFALMDPLDRAAYWSDVYHFNDKGRRLQAEQVAGFIRAAMGGKSATEEEASSALRGAASQTGPDGPVQVPRK